MKKIAMIIGVFIIIVVAYVFVNKLYYPPLPIADLSAKETIDRLNHSDSNLVQIADEENSLWYITRMENSGIETTDENVKKLLLSEGWQFKEKEGSGLIFKKNGARLIATTQMWTEQYVLVNVPKL